MAKDRISTPGSYRPVLAGSCLGLIVGLILVILSVIGVFSPLEFRSMDYRFRLRGPLPTGDNVVIVEVDDQSIDDAGVYPIPREQYGKLVDKLARGGAAVVGFDFSYYQPDRHPGSDQLFAQASRRFGKVFFALVCTKGEPDAGAKDDEKQRVDLTRFAGHYEARDRIAVNQAQAVLPPVAPLLHAAKGVGHINQTPEPDGAARRATLVMDYRGQPYPFLGLAIAAYHLKYNPSQVEVAPGKWVTIGSRRVPIDRSGESFINFLGGYHGETEKGYSESFPWVSFSEVMTGKIAPEFFKDKIVMVGATAAGTYDEKLTPFCPNLPGVYINATVIHNVLKSGFLKPLGPGLAGLLVLALCIGAGLLGVWLRPIKAVIAVGLLAIAWTIFSAWVFGHSRIALPLVVPLLGLAFTYGATLTYGFWQEQKERARADAAAVTLAEVTRMIGGAQDPRTLLTNISQGVAKLMRAEEARILVQNEAARRALSGDAKQGLPGVEILKEAEKKTDTSGPDLLAPGQERIAGQTGGKGEATTLIEEPLKGLGTIQIIRKSGIGPPSASEGELLRALGEYVRVTVLNTCLQQENRDILVESIKVLTTEIAERDGYTSQHCEDVTNHSRAIAGKLNLSEQAIRDIELGSLLHDIGKVWVEDQVLNKAGKLNDEEWASMQQHPGRGARVLRPAEHLRGILPIVRHHHERYDGTGYPDGIRGEQIPLGARIVAAADAYSAMTSHRPYRPAMPQDKVVGIMMEERGKQFDPDVVDAFLEIIKEGIPSEAA